MRQRLATDPGAPARPARDRVAANTQAISAVGIEMIEDVLQTASVQEPGVRYIRGALKEETLQVIVIYLCMM